MFRVLRKLVLTGAWLSLCQCATVFNGAYSGQVKFESEPDGALVVIDQGYPSCYTPCHLQVAMDRPHTYILTVPGYEPAKGQLERKITGTFWLNGVLGVGGLVTSSLDWFTDSMWVLKKNTVSTTLLVASADSATRVKATPKAAATTAPQEFKDRMAAQYPQPVMRDTIQNNFGVMSKEERAELSDRLIYYMWQMDLQGVPPDLETAVTREQSRRQKN